MVRVRSIVESLRHSLFFVPLLFVAASIIVAMAMIRIDDSIDGEASSLPFAVGSTVDSARAVLSTVATATVTVAGIAFSVSLLIFQMASSQYSPRVIHGLFRDRYNKRVIGLVVGTFTYCLLVLRTVRGPLADSGEAVVPTLSVNLAVVLGIVSILAIVAFINHSAHLMDISRILQDVSDDARRQLRAVWSPRDAEPGSGESSEPVLPILEAENRGPGHHIAFDRDGWIQQVDVDRLLQVVPPGGVVVLETVPGRYAVEGTTFCTVWPALSDGESSRREALRSVDLGSGRTLPGDVSYGIRRLVDVALKALSPGINDPTTAQDAIFHLVAVLREALVREPPSPLHEGLEGRKLASPEAATAADLVDLACDELRRAAAEHPAVCVYLLEALALLRDGVAGTARSEAVAAVRRQALLVVEGCERAGALEVDVRRVREAYEVRFGGPSPTGHES